MHSFYHKDTIMYEWRLRPWEGEMKKVITLITAVSWLHPSGLPPLSAREWK